MKRKISVKKIAVIGMFSALGTVLALLGKVIPSVAGFLDYDPKDVIVCICGFMLGPIYSFAVSLISSFIEFIWFGSSGIIGFFMNVISTASFACTAAFIYKRKRTFKKAIIGLVVGVLFMTATMVLWNVIVTPYYMHVPRETVIGMLPTVFIPFNLAKGTINAILTVILYKPLVKALRRMRLVEEREIRKTEEKEGNDGENTGI